jgi:transcriptional regulator with PAS, ATPase and Fis domain
MDTQNTTQSGAPAQPLKTLQQVGDEHILAVIAATRTLDDAAEILGIDIATLYRKRVRMKLVISRQRSERQARKPKPIGKFR